VVFTGILVLIWALNTENAINTVNHIAVGLLLVLCLVMLKSVISGNEVKEIASNITFGAALELSIIMPLTWLPLISDYTMMGRSARGSFWGSFGGYFIGSSFMYAIGLVSSIYAGTPDPIGVLTSLNLGLSALLIVVLSTVTTTFLDVYSAVMSTSQRDRENIEEQMIFIFGALGILLAMYFPMEQYENFLYMISGRFLRRFSLS
jgi:putative hydroxymethylpyrimidine transporter CytX